MIGTAGSVPQLVAAVPASELEYARPGRFGLARFDLARFGPPLHYLARFVQNRLVLVRHSLDRFGLFRFFQLLRRRGRRLLLHLRDE